MFIAGDVGGTKTRLAFYRLSGSEFVGHDIKQFDSRAFPSPEAMILEYLKVSDNKPAAVCLGVPGPVVDGVVKVTNLPWILREAEMTKALGVPVKLVNDLVATAAGAIILSRDDVTVIQAGSEKRTKDVWTVVAPGTGLGQASIHYVQGVPYVLPSEGGHADFAPLDDLQIQLFNYLRNKLGKRVSVERLVCGPGLVNIFSFLKDEGIDVVSPALEEQFASGKDPAAVIGENAISRSQSICVKAMELFISILGAHSGNCVLTYMGTGGLYLGGGIPPKVINENTKDIFLASFLNKGRLSHLIESTPVYLIKDDTAALKGAAAFAAGQVRT